MLHSSALHVLFGKALDSGLDDHDRDLWHAIREQAEGGKRFRPKLLLSMYDALGGTDSGVANAVADAVELLHTAFVMQDDVIDGDEVRRGRPNVMGSFAARAREAGADEHRAGRYGAAAGILAGDLALAGALRCIATSGADTAVLTRLFDLIDDVLHRSAAGELADVRVAFAGAELSDILNIAAWKTAAYSFELPMQGAAILAGADDALISSMGRAGRAIGIAFQLLDDLDGVFAPADQTGKDPLSDLREGKFTGLIAFARDTEQWTELSRYVGKPDLTIGEASRARDLLTASGARASVAALVDEHRTLALEEARALPPAAGAVVAETISLVLPHGQRCRQEGVA